MKNILYFYLPFEFMLRFRDVFHKSPGCFELGWCKIAFSWFPNEARNNFGGPVQRNYLSMMTNGYGAYEEQILKSPLMVDSFGKVSLLYSLW